MLLADDMHGAPVWQMPPVILRFERRIGLKLARLPILVVRLLLQHARIAQTVQNLAIAWRRRQPVGIKGPQLGIGGIVEAQALVRPENGDGRIQLVQRGSMGLRMTFQFLLRGFKRRHIIGKTGGAFGNRHIINIKRPLHAADHRMAAAERARRGRGAVEFIFVKQRSASRDRGVNIRRFNRFDIGPIGPDQFFGFVFQPDRPRCRVKHGRKPFNLFAQTSRVIGQFSDLLAIACKRAKPQCRKPAGCTPVCLQQFI